VDIPTIIFFISLFIMLTAAISTELIRSKRMKTFYLGIFFLNSICFLTGVALFMWAHSAIYMVAGMLFSSGMLGITYFKYSDF
jgi:hypothetical protein